MTLANCQDALDLLGIEKDRYPYGIHSTATVAAYGVIRAAHNALTWALDEIAQLREDNADLSGRLADAEEAVEGYESDALMNEQRLDYIRGV